MNNQYYPPQEKTKEPPISNLHAAGYLLISLVLLASIVGIPYLIYLAFKN